MNMFLISVCWIYCAMIGVMQSGAIRTGSTIAKYSRIIISEIAKRHAIKIFSDNYCNFNRDKYNLTL